MLYCMIEYMNEMRTRTSVYAIGAWFSSGAEMGCWSKHVWLRWTEVPLAYL